MSPFLKEYDGNEDDELLVNEAKAGNKKALEKLLLKHQPYIYNLAWRMVRQPKDAEDLTQEVNVKIITKLSEFQGRSAFRTWLYRIVTNHFLMAQRKPMEEYMSGFDKHAEGLLKVKKDEVELSTEEMEQHRDTIKEVTYGCMSGMLLCLTREQRLVYILGDMFRADHTVGSEMLEISKSNFRQRLTRARQDMNNYMQNKCGLVNPKNPCRCHKKVQFVLKNKIVDSRNLLFNREEYVNFHHEVVKPHTHQTRELIDDKYQELLRNLPFKKDMDKSTILDDVINDKRFKNLFNLN